MCRLICLDDTKKPKEIPQEKWIVRGEEYVAIWVTLHATQKNMKGVQLAEIMLDESCDPYNAFKLSRFAIHEDDLEEFIKLAKDCSEFSEKDIKDFIKQEQLVILED
jgi:hypothetical protein